MRGTEAARRSTDGPSWLTVWIVALLLIAGAAAWATRSSPTLTPTPTPTGWITFREAASILQPMVNGTPGGPWGLLFASGVAANGPWSPMVSGTFGATPLCAAKLSGISLFTYWNASLYPRADWPGVFSSGTAPLWTFGYLNSANSTSIFSVVNGSRSYNGIWTAASQCVMNDTLGVPPGFSPDSVLDSSRIAGSIPSSFWGLGPQHALYTIGPWLTGVETNSYNTGSSRGDHLPTWYVTSSRCGLPGAAARITPETIYVNSTSGDAGPGGWQGSPVDCASIGARGSFGPPTVRVLANGSGSAVSFRLGLTPETSQVPPSKDWTIIRTDSLTVGVWENSTTTPAYAVAIEPAGAACVSGALTVYDCPANATGWYVVLTDSHGNWLDSFPSFAGGGNWTRPGVSVASGDLLVLVVPAEIPVEKGVYLAYSLPEHVLGDSYVEI